MFRTTSKFFLFAIIVIAIAQAAIHFKVSSELSEPIQFAQLATQSNISHGLIYANYDGELTISQVKFDAPQMGISLNIDALKLKGLGLIETITFNAKAFQLNDLPEKMWIALEGGSIALDPRVIDLNTPASNQSPDFIGQLDALACGNIGQFGLGDYLAMGYSRINFDTRVDANFDLPHNEIEVNVESSATNISSMMLSFVLSNISTESKQIPSLKKLSFKNNDHSLVASKNKYCAQISGASPAQYIDEHIKQLDRHLMRSNIPLSESLLVSYREYLNKPQSFQLTLHPASPVQVLDFQRYQPVQLVDLLGASLLINDIEVLPILDFGRQLSEEALKDTEEAPEESADALTSSSSKENKSPDAKPRTPKYFKYQDTQPNALRQYSNHEAKLLLKNGKKHWGVIKKIYPDYFDFESRTGKGQLTMPIKYADVRQAEVFR